MANRSPLKFLPDGTPNPKWKKRASGKSGRSRSKFERAEFIAIDSEGIDEQQQQQQQQATWLTRVRRTLSRKPASLEQLNRERPSTPHKSVLWMASSGEKLYDAQGLKPAAVRAWLLDLAEAHPKATFVCYGASYDCNMLLKDLSRDQVLELLALQKETEVDIDDNAKPRRWLYLPKEGIRLRWVPRKSLVMQRYAKRAGQPPKAGVTFTLWDVIGFYQASFIGAVESNLGKDYTELPIIREGKAGRESFGEETSEDYLTRYTGAELKALVRLVEHLRDACEDAGLRLRRWDGAGAVAAAMMAKHGVKEHIGNHPQPVQQAALHAYFGGRIEALQYGHTKEKVYGYDVNSAYPFAMHDLPSLTEGHWRHLGPVEPEDVAGMAKVSIFRVRWNYGDFETQDCPLYPFAYRSRWQLKILYPSQGHNWVWKPELEAALKWEERLGGVPVIEEAWEYVPDLGGILPFAYIKEYYEERQRLITQAKLMGVIPPGQEKVLKLGLNSQYGKTAQKSGAFGKKPPYQDYVVAGYTTAFTRATLFDAAMQDPEAVVSIQTDGIYTTRPLDLPVSKTKEFGLWEASEVDELIMVQSGVYLSRKGNKPWYIKCRGFNKPKNAEEGQAMVDGVLQGYQDDRREIVWRSRRFITAGLAAAGEELFQRWCTWYEPLAQAVGGKVEPGRKLKLTPEGTKRCPALGVPEEPAKGLVRTVPMWTIETEADELSEPYEATYLAKELPEALEEDEECRAMDDMEV